MAYDDVTTLFTVSANWAYDAVLDLLLYDALNAYELDIAFNTYDADIELVAKLELTAFNT